MTPEARRLRITSTAGVFFMLLVVALARVCQLSVVDAAWLTQLARGQYGLRVAVSGPRGAVVDRHGDALVLTMEAAGMFVRPHHLHLDKDTIPVLARTLGLAPDVVARKAHDPRPFVWLSRNVTADQAAAVAALALPGVGSEPSWRRFYPRGALAGQVLGFTGVDAQGLAGVELAYDRYIRGAAESVRVDRDAHGRQMLTEHAWRLLPQQGARVELTIDATLQQITERQLEAAVTMRQAAAGLAAVMDPSTGEILALAHVPRFDPGRFRESTPDQWRNRVVSDSYEPGSTFKGILAAAAIDAGVVQPDEQIYCEDGRYRFGRHVVHDHHAHGWLTFAEVIKYSSNIGSAKVAQRLGAGRLAAAIEAFGFGARTGIDLPGEAPGLVRPARTWGAIDLATVSFGQGIAVTPLQLLRAYAAIANGGRLLRPYVVRRVVGADGTTLREQRPEVLGHPISAGTAAIMTDLLRGVVADGTGAPARVDGMPAAGKTGTAQKVDLQTGGYSRRDRISSFVGFVPAEAPRFVILVIVDSPRTVTYGGIVAGPVFRGIAEYAVDRLGLRAMALPPPLPSDRRAGASVVNWVVRAADRGLPSFIGLSMRAALVEATRAGWEVETYGSGFVVEQDPRPGTETMDGRTLRLRFGSAAG